MEIYRNLWKIYRKFIEINRNPSKSMEIHRKSMEFVGTSMGNQWESKELREKSMRNLWKSMEIHRESMEIHGNHDNP